MAPHARGVCANRPILAVGLGVLLAACGTSAQPEVQSAPPLAADSVAARQTGSAAAEIIPSTIVYRIDDSGALVIRLQVQSESSAAETITLRASLYDAAGAIVGDATGGAIAVQPGSVAEVQLNGPGPHGTIASAVFEVSDIPAPTPVVSTPVPTGNL